MSFIQLKRKSNDDPKEILVLASKKKKIENIKEDASIFEFAGTVVQKEEINHVIGKKIKEIRDPKVKKFDLEKITSQLRTEHLQRSKHSRLQVLNCMRDVDENAENDEKSVTVIDLSNDDENSCKNEQGEYVYDIYYSQSGIDANDPDFVKNYAVHEVNGVWQDANSDEENDVVEDEDDSNDESNWRNDYPDEDDYGLDSNDEDDCEYMTRKMEKTNLSEYSLSSDEFDEDIRNEILGIPRKTRFKKSGGIDYYDEVVSDESDSS